MAAQPHPDFDPRDPAAVAAALAKLSPQQAAAFIDRLEKIMLRRRIQTWGYLLALLVFAVGAIVGLTYWALVQTWTSLMLLTVPVMLAGMIMMAFGRWAKKI